MTVVPDSQSGIGSRTEFLEAVFSALSEGLFVTDDDGIVEVTNSLCDLLGYERDELVGAQPPLPFLPPEDAGRFEALRGRLEQFGHDGYELTLMRKDGSRFPALISAGVVRDENGHELGRVVTVRDISGRRRREDRLAMMAATDELTGLLNKRSFLVNLAGEVARARRHSRRLSLVIFDLDGFKEVNDAGGHQTGDRVLAEAAGRLAALARSGEHLARIGGDEFAWILPEADSDGAVAAANRARMAISGEPFRHAGGLSLSAGVCESEGDIDAGELYRRADRALYAAKTAGGDQAHIY